MQALSLIKQFLNSFQLAHTKSSSSAWALQLQPPAQLYLRNKYNNHSWNTNSWSQISNKKRMVDSISTS